MPTFVGGAHADLRRRGRPANPARRIAVEQSIARRGAAEPRGASDMLTMDVFNNNAFSATSMTAAVDKLGYVPGFLGSIPGLFVPKPVNTEQVFIEERLNAPALIQTTLRGEPPKRKAGDTRTARSFKTLRLAQSSRITAAELQGIREFGSETELKQLMNEVARRQQVMRADLELTRENMYLGAVQGLVTDADGTTLYDWAAEFNQVIPAEVDFDLDNASPASGVVRKACNAARRSILKALKGLGGNAVSVLALCGDAFWDDLTAHSEARQTYLNTMEAKSLRENIVWETFSYGGVTFANYRGSDDGAVGINTDKAKFFPVGAGIFQVAQAPAETFDFVNTPGQEVYSWVVEDKDRNAWADVDLFSYPLPVCTMPSALYRARRT
jgi:hypothetical protein